MASLIASVPRFFIQHEEGVSLVEYALLVALLAGVCLVAITLSGTSISDMLNNLGIKLSDLAP